MLPFDPTDPHVKAYRQWHKAVWSAKTFPHLEDIFSRMAVVWMMRYETLVAIKQHENRKENSR